MNPGYIRFLFIFSSFSLMKYSTALTSWFVASSIAFTLLESSKLKKYIFFGVFADLFQKKDLTL